MQRSGRSLYRRVGVESQDEMVDVCRYTVNWPINEEEQEEINEEALSSSSLVVPY